MTFATTEEIEQYARMTLKQFGLSDYTIEWNKKLKRTLGLCYAWEKRIELNPQILASFQAFKKVLTHECVHGVQYKRMGGSFKAKKRNSFHGKVWKEVCKEYKVSPARFIQI